MSPRVQAGLPLVVLLAGLGAWCLYGWNLEPVAPYGALFPEFPIGALAALFSGVLAAVVLALTGAALVPRGAHRCEPLAMVALSFLVGGAVAGAVGGWLAFVVILPGLLTLAAVPLIIRARSGTWLMEALPGRGRWGAAEGWFAAVAVALVLVAALAPAVESDGLRYHLVGPQEWSRAGRFTLIPYSAHTNLPAMLGLLTVAFAGAVELGRSFQVLHACHLAALAVVSGQLAEAVFRGFLASRRCRRGDVTPAPGIVRGIGAALPLGVPVVVVVAAWPFSDVASVAYLMAAVWVLAPGTIRGAAWRMALAGLLLGGCVATKLSNLPLACLVAAWGAGALLLRCGGMRTARAVLLMSVAGAAVLGPWCVKNAIHHGNPLYPVAYGVFGGPEWSAENDAFYKAKVKEKGVGHDVAALIRSPWDVSVGSDQPTFEGHNPGPLLLATLPLAALVAGWLGLARRRLGGAAGGLCVLLVGGWVVWFATYQSARFLMPEILAAALLGAGLVLALASAAGGQSVRTARCVLGAVVLAGAVWPVVYQSSVVPVYQSAVGLFSPEFYAARRFNAATAVAWLNENCEAGEPVVYIGEHRAAGARSFRPIASDWFDTPRILAELRSAPDNAALLAGWRAGGVRHVLLNQAELSGYEVRYFRPRFAAEEWERFEALRRALLQHIVFDSGEGVYVLRLPEAP